MFMKTPHDRAEHSGHRLDYALTLMKVNGAELARRLGLDNEQNITNWKSRGVPASRVTAVAKALCISRDWLESGTGKPRIHNFDLNPSDDHSDTNTDGPEFAVNQGRVPVIGKAQLGPDGYFDAMDYPVGHGDGYLNISSQDKNAYALRVVGNSMTPRIRNNEFVLIEPNTSYVTGDEVLVKTTKGKAMIKEFIYLRDGQYRLDSVNQGYEPIFIPADQVDKVHFVAGIFKSIRHTPD